MNFEKTKVKIIVFILFCLGLLGVAKSSWAGTFYIDYATGDDARSALQAQNKNTPWATAPGMLTKGGVTRGAYVHTAADQFIFRGGVTWPASTLPLTISASGISGHVDSYTVDQTWYSGDSWSKPILDAEGALGNSANIIIAYNRSYILINGLQIQNIGNAGPGKDGSGTAIAFFGGGHIEISNCSIYPNSIEAFGYSTNNTNTSELSFHDNNIARAGRFVIYGDTGYAVDDVRVYNNRIAGMADSYSGGYHTDGLMIGNALGAECSSTKKPTVTNVRFYGNYFYGDWHQGATAQYYSNGCVGNTYIYNNVFSFEDSAGSAGMIFVRLGYYDSGIAAIYNNTFSSDAHPEKDVGANIGIASAYPQGDVVYTIEGNVFSGVAIDIALDTGFSSATIDYNLHNPTSVGGYGDVLWIGSTQYNTLSACRAAGYELQGKTGDPKFAAIPNGITGSGNFRLQPDSPAKDALPTIAAPTQFFTTDILGVSRPQGSAWDIGAYEYVQGGDTTPPAAPSGVTVN
jgi:hypothetical protein